MGGPLNLVIVPVVGAIMGTFVSVLCFLPLGLAQERYGIRYRSLAFALIGVVSLLGALSAMLFYVSGNSMDPLLGALFMIVVMFFSIGCPV